MCGDGNARVTPQPKRNRDFALRSRWQRLLADEIQSGGFEPLRHGLGGEAKAAMRVNVAQEFEIVRCKINHQQASARTQHPRGFTDRATAVVEEVQNLMNNDDVE